MSDATAPTFLPDAAPPADERPHPRIPVGAVAYAILAVAIMAVFRLSWMGDRIVPVGYGVPLVAFAWYRNRRALWATAAAFALLTFVRFFVPFWDNRIPLSLPARARAIDMALVLIDLTVVAAAVHFLIGYRRTLERRNAQLQQGFDQIAAREGQIARQNRELQRGAEVLAQQAQELRSSNGELAARERTLRAMLDLSRALGPELTREQTLQRICEALGELLNSVAGANVGEARWATAVIEHENDQLCVRCHHGFGPGGVAAERLSLDDAFAAQVLRQGKTAHVDDLSLRPELRIPHSAEGPAFASVLSAPLRAGGWPVGTLEAYACDPTAWSDEQVALVESLAAQASNSLEAAHLFETVQQERRRLQTVLQATPVGVAVSDAGGQDVRLNPAGAAMFDVAPDANIALPDVSGTWRRLHEGQMMEAGQSPLARACRGEEVRGYEMELRLPDGRELALLVNAVPIRGRDGRVTGSVAAFTDVTALKSLQRELEQRRAEAEEASVRKTRFLAAVSHDIRTPANAISLLAELIRRSASSPEMAADVPELAEELHGSALSLVNLLSDVLDVARFDSGRIEMRETTFDLAAAFAEEARQMHALARDKGLALNYVPPAKPLTLRADRIKLSRVLGNLVGNAIKFTAAGEVTVRAEPQSDRGAAIFVSDTGIGIPAEHQRHVFDEFFQLDNPERDRNKGTGLGLTICSRLVAAMGGRLDVRSAPGKGSVFTVTLPPRCVIGEGGTAGGATEGG